MFEQIRTFVDWCKGLIQKPAIGDPRPHPPEPVVMPKPAPEKPYEPVQDKLRDARQDGLDTALASGDLTPDETRFTAASDAWIGKLDAIFKGPLDTLKNLADALLKRDLDQGTEKLRRAESILDHTRRKADEAQEAVSPPEPPPQASIFVIMMAILALTGNFTMTFGELPLFRDLEDEVKLLLSGALGFVIAATCIASLYGLMPYDPDASVVRPNGVKDGQSTLAGLFVVCALALTRLALTSDDYLLTGGLALLDAGILLYVKDNSSQHRNRIAVHAERNDSRIQRLKYAADMQAEVERDEAVTAQLAAELQAIRKRYEDRLRHDFDMDKIAPACIAAWRDGYLSGIDMNRRPRSGRQAA